MRNRMPRKASVHHRAARFSKAGIRVRPFSRKTIQ
jgi:hypothetical protein